MNVTIITCTHCNKPFTLSDAISHQIEDELRHAKQEQAENLRKEFDATTEEQTNNAIEAALAKAKQEADAKLTKSKQEAELAIKIAQQEKELESERQKQYAELEANKLRLSIESSKESEKQLREQLASLIEQLNKANQAKNNAELVARKEMAEKEAQIRKEATQKASESLTEKIREQDQLISKLKLDADIETKKAKQQVEHEFERIKQHAMLEIQKLQTQITSSKDSEKQLREQLSTLLEELNKANKAKDNAELVARKDLYEKEKIIREEASQRASEDYNTKIREQEETINKLREQLTISKQVAEQGSQQLQGEILELDIEKILRSNFPYDTINEVKKGERGSDVRQSVNEQFFKDCGLILWEAKNAKTFQPAWVVKLKDEMANEKAQLGVIVFNSPSNESDDYKQIEDNIWLVKPRYVLMLASLLREVLLKVSIANRNAQGKDVKIEMMYNYLTGGEFNNRVRYIIESYNEMTTQLNLEKKQTQKRWATQEKIIQKVTSSLYGMSGDLQGIAGQEIIALPELEEVESYE